MTNLIKKLMPFTIILGTFMIALGLATFNGATVIQQKTVFVGAYDYTFYTFNLSLYLQNLEQSLKGSFLTNIAPNFPNVPMTAKTSYIRLD